MTYQETLCIDAGTESCPCLLAQSGDCITCSRLQGKAYCDCTWRGVCVYNEYMQNGRRISNKRESRPVKIRKKIWYGDRLLVLVLEVSKGFALKASMPGSFVFLKECGRQDCYSVPLSVMRAEPEKGQIHVAVSVTAGKTKALAQAAGSIELRGVYRSGLLGVSRLLTKEPRRVLCLTRGIGFAPAANYIRWAFGKDTVDMIIDPEKISQELVNDYLQDHPVNHICYQSLSDLLARGGGTVPDALFSTAADSPQDYDVVMLLASDYFIENLPAKMHIPAHKLVCSNNFHMCCGEGICGACTVVDAEGRSHKMCKCANLP